MSIEARLAAMDLPLPLKRRVDRILGLLSGEKRQDELLHLAEMTCRVSGLVSLAVCRHLGLRSDGLDRVSAELHRPTFGHWVALLRTCAGLLHENNDELLRPLSAGLFAKVPKGSDIEALSHALKGRDGRAAATTLEVYEAFIRHRNALRHGVAGDAGQKEKDLDLMLAGMLALWEAAPPAGGLRVVHVVRVEQSAAGAFADVLAMHGSAPTASRVSIAAGDGELAGTVQLLKAPSTWVRLSPLAAAEEGPAGPALGWLSGSVLAPSFKYQSDSREFQANTTQDEYEGVLGIARGAAIDAALQERLRLDPYRGLLAYEEVDQPVFFGREEETARAVAMLAERGAVVIAGASGSGKSSMMRAGLVPALKKRGDDDSKESMPLVFVPGKRPLEALRTLIRAAGPEGAAEAAAWSRSVDDLLSEAHGRPDGLVHLVRGLAGRTRTPVLCVDQLEELVTTDAGPGERRAFLDAIVHAASAGVPVAVTVRSDLIAPLLEHEGFRSLHDRSVLSIGGLSSGQLDRIIREPLRGRHVEIEDGLAAVIVREVEGRPGALALLSQVLTTLWEERGSFGGRLTKAGYQAAGGVQGCVAAQASKARDEVPPDARPRLDAVLLQLVARGDQDTFVRRRVDLAEAAQVLGTPATEIRALLAPFVARRLIVLSTAAPEGAEAARQTAEVAHEALISGWPHLRDLVASQSEVLELRRRVEDGAHAWEAAGRRREFWNDDHSNLRRSEELLGAGRLALPAPQRAFLAASRNRVRTRRRLQRAMIAALALLLAAAAIGFVLADLARRQADEATKAANAATAETKDAKHLVDQRNSDLAKQERLKRADAYGLTASSGLPPRLAIAHGIAALRMDPDRGPSTWAACVRAAGDGAKCVWTSPDAATTDAEVVGVAFVGPGTHGACGTNSGEVMWFDALTGTPDRVVWISPGATCVVFSPDGTVIASGSRDGTISLWDGATGGDRGKLEGHGKVVTSLAFSADGTRLVSGSLDTTVRVWDVQKKALSKTFEGHSQQVNAVAFAPDGRRVASASRDKTARVWDLATGSSIRTLEGHGDRLFGVAFSHDGRFVATAANDKTVKVWDVVAGGPERTFRGHDEGVVTVAFRPDDAVLASGSIDGTVRLWDLAHGGGSPASSKPASAAGGGQIRRLTGHTFAVPHVAWSPTGDLLITGSDDKSVRTWDAATGRMLRPLDGHTDVVKSVAFSPNGAKIASASWDATVRIWDAATGRQLHRLRHPLGVNSVAFSPDGSTIASAGFDQTVRIWDVETGVERRKLAGHKEGVICVAFSPSEPTLASGGMDGRIILWDLASGTAARTMTLPNPLAQRDGATSAPSEPPTVESISFNLNGEEIVSGSNDGVVRFWDVATGTMVRRFSQPESVLSVVYDADGASVLASGSVRGDLVAWNLAKERVVGTFGGHSGFITCIAAARKYRTATGSVDRTVRITDVDWTILLEGHRAAVYGVAFSPDGGRLASASSDHTVRLWDLSAASELRKIGEAAPFAVTTVVSPDGSLIATSDEANQVSVWSVATGERAGSFKGHQDSVGRLAFSRDGALLASGSRDRTVRLWDLRKGAHPQPLVGHTEGIEALAIDEDGKRIATSAWDFSIRVWDIQTGKELRRFEGLGSTATSLVFSEPDVLAVGLADGDLKLWDLKPGAPVKLGDPADADVTRRLQARSPISVRNTQRVYAGAAEWLAARFEQSKHAGGGLSPRVATFLDAWERAVGVRVDLETGRVNAIGQPGPAYVGKPEAEWCK